MTNPLLVGVDVHRKTNVVCPMDVSGREVGQHFKVDNDLPGTAAFVDKVSSLAEEGGYDAILVAAEAAAMYW